MVSYGVVCGEGVNVGVKGTSHSTGEATINEAISDARNKAGWAISIGSATLPIGAQALFSASRCLGSGLVSTSICKRGVLVTPGQTELTRILYLMRSKAIDFVSITTPALEAS